MASVNFKRGLLSQLPVGLTDGTIYITTDEGAMYVDTGNKRVRLGDFIPVNTINDLPVAGHAYETAVYYVKENNILARWDATNARWVQINKAGIVRVSDDPNNEVGANVVSAITTSVAANGELTLVVTKQTVATSQDLSDLAATVAAHTTSLATINGNGVGSITKAVNDARDALLGDASTYTTLGALEDAIEDLLGLKTRVKTNEQDISDLSSSVSTLTTTVSGHTRAINTLNGDANTAGSVAKAVADEAALRSAGDAANASDITALQDRLGNDEADISKNATDIAALQRVVGSGSTGLEARVTANENAISTLNGNGEGSVVKTVNDRIATVVAEAPEAFDTLKEIADWIGENSDDALTMQANISDNTAAIEALKARATTIENAATALTGRVTTAESDIDTLEAAITRLDGNADVTGSVDQKIASALTSVNADISAANSDISALQTRMTTAEGKLDIIQGSDSTEGSIAYAVKQEADARAAADTALGGRIDGLNTRLGDAESDISSLQTSMTTVVNQLTWVEF